MCRFPPAPPPPQWREERERERETRHFALSNEVTLSQYVCVCVCVWVCAPCTLHPPLLVSPDSRLGSTAPGGGKKGGEAGKECQVAGVMLCLPARARDWFNLSDLQPRGSNLPCHQILAGPNNAHYNPPPPPGPDLFCTTNWRTGSSPIFFFVIPLYRHHAPLGLF